MAILLRVFWVAIITGPEEAAYRDPVVATRVVRGTVTDRNGRIIAIETPYHSCALLLREIADLRETAKVIGSVLSIDPDSIIADLPPTPPISRETLSDGRRIRTARQLDRIEGDHVGPRRNASRTFPNITGYIDRITNTETEASKGGADT